MLQSLSFNNFRCFDSASWAPGGGRHILVGANGAGKTSVLEAIYFLATTKSFRSSRLQDCLSWQGDELWVRGRLEGDRGDELVASWRPGGSRRTINAKPAALGDYLSRLPAVAWSARDDSLLDGNPGSRRRLLDQGIVSRKPLEVEVLAKYRNVLAAKRRLLAGGADRSADGTIDSWNALQARVGHRLISLRAAYVAELQSAFAETVADHRVGLRRVDFLYRPSPRSGAASEEAFREELDRVRSDELARRRSMIGPHRDRLELRWGESDIGRSASAGERKLFGLVLTAARRRVLQASGREPIVLLDDLDATLDGAHLEAAWRLYEGVPQVVASSANPETGRRFGEVETWRLAGGVIEPF